MGITMKLLTDVEIKLIKQEAVVEYKRLQNENVLKIQNEIECREDAMVGFNFGDPLISVFSIERIHQNTVDERTVLGYYLTNEKEPKIQTWHLYISRSQHNDLVKTWVSYHSEKSLKSKKKLLKG
jgi:hypothetical protein